jgi:hypothetical protein
VAPPVERAIQVPIVVGCIEFSPGMAPFLQSDNQRLTARPNVERRMNFYQQKGTRWLQV